MKIALIGAGSYSFGPASLRDVFLSDPVNAGEVELRLMDVARDRLEAMLAYGRHLNDKLNRKVRLSATTDLNEALKGVDFAICAIEVKRMHYWSMDFHVPRQFGFRQPYGENGGPGGIFHTLRNIPPMMTIARTLCDMAPDAWLLNYTNPEHKLCEALTRLTGAKVVGLCHGIYGGLSQLCRMLEIPWEHLEAWACGINHFTFFESIRDKRTGEDLYPRLRAIDRDGHELANWHEIGLGRMLFRRFGRWPSPASNHYGEYVSWGQEYVVDQTQFFYDPMAGNPWENGRTPQFIYELTDKDTHRPWTPEPEQPPKLEAAPLKPSGEFGVSLIEAIGCGREQMIPAVNIPNRGAIPNLPEEAVVEVPAMASPAGLKPRPMMPLPEGIAAMVRLQLSIHKLIVEAYAEQSKDKLLQAILLDPTVDSYRRAVAMMETMLRLQKEILPPLR